MLLWQESEHSNVQDKVTLSFLTEALPMVTEMTEVPNLLRQRLQLSTTLPWDVPERLPNAVHTGQP